MEVTMPECIRTFQWLSQGYYHYSRAQRHAFGGVLLVLTLQMSEDNRIKKIKHTNTRTCINVTTLVFAKLNVKSKLKTLGCNVLMKRNWID